MKVLVVILAALQKGHVGDHKNRGFMMQSAFFVTRSNFKRVPGHVKSLHKLYN